jgi:chromate reductase, NAD(P)H dehydrogenase (quinone)
MRLCHACAVAPIMSTPHRVAVFYGSLRRDAYSHMLAVALHDMAPATLALKIVEIGALPLYNPDLEADAPPAWCAFREQVAASDAVLFVTPEYNRSVPAALKNALDVGSRPYGSNVWNGKPGAVASLSPGALGGFGANHHLRQSLAHLNVATMAQPEIYLTGLDAILDDGGRIVRTEAQTLLRCFLQTFADWVERNVRVAAR